MKVTMTLEFDSVGQLKSYLAESNPTWMKHLPEMTKKETSYYKGLKPATKKHYRPKRHNN